MSLSPSFSCQLPAKHSLRQGFRSTRLQRGCFFRKTGVRGWSRIGGGGKGLREGLVWPDWEALESKSSLSKVILPEAEARLLSSRGKALERGTGRRRGSCLPSSVISSPGWPSEVSGVVGAGHRTATGKEVGLWTKGPWVGPTALSIASCHHTGPL